MPAEKNSFLREQLWRDFFSFGEAITGRLVTTNDGAWPASRHDLSESCKSLLRATAPMVVL